MSPVPRTTGTTLDQLAYWNESELGVPGNQCRFGGSAGLSQADDRTFIHKIAILRGTGGTGGTGGT